MVLKHGPENSASPFEVLVTPQIILKNEKNAGLESYLDDARFDQNLGSFCDWISIYQHHDVTLPTLHDGCFIKYDKDGSYESTTLRKLNFEGSHSSSLFIRCTGSSVHLEGNLSKFDRSDNVFGYSLRDCIKKANAFLRTLGLPPFTCGESFLTITPDGKVKREFTGARITRIDFTQNYAAGSKSDAYTYLRHISSQNMPRLKTGVSADGQTVDWGRGSRAVYSKIYLKVAELIKRLKKSKLSLEQLEYMANVIRWAEEVGLLRFETTYKSTFLIDNGYQFLGSINVPELESEFINYRQNVIKRSVKSEDLDNMPPKVLKIYRLWQAGDDLTAFVSQATFYRYRNQLLPYGIDISQPSNVNQIKVPIKVIKLSPVSPPDFYNLPPINSHLRSVA